MEVIHTENCFLIFHCRMSLCVNMKDEVLKEIFLGIEWFWTVSGKNLGSWYFLGDPIHVTGYVDVHSRNAFVCTSNAPRNNACYIELPIHFTHQCWTSITLEGQREWGKLVMSLILILSFKLHLAIVWWITNVYLVHVVL